MTNPLLQLKELGQSVWYDNIDRSQLASGQFQRMLDEDGVVGAASKSRRTWHTIPKRPFQRCAASGKWSTAPI